MLIHITRFNILVTFAYTTRFRKITFTFIESKRITNSTSHDQYFESSIFFVHNQIVNNYTSTDFNKIKNVIFL